MSIYLLLSVVLIIFGLAVLALYAYAHLQADDSKSHQRIKDLEKALSDSQQELQNEHQSLEKLIRTSGISSQILSQMSKAVVFIDSKRHIQLINGAAEPFFDLTNVLGQPYTQALHWKNAQNEPDFSLFEAAFTGSTQVIPEGYTITGGRDTFPVAGVISPIKDELSGAISGIVMVFEDNTRLLERIAEEKAFFSTAAHELRSPITVIRAAADTLKEYYDKLPRKDIDELLKTTDDTSVQLLTLVNDFLNVSRLEQGRLEVKKAPFDLIKLTKEIVQEQTPVAKMRHLYLNHDIQDLGVRMVVGDEQKSKEVIINLISNALKYTLQGGITISHREGNNTVITSVSDTGVGIQKDSQSLLFKRFQQIGYARGQSTAKSTGLGLYIAKKMAKLMGGDLVLEKSEPGVGSTFNFILPRA